MQSYQKIKLFLMRNISKIVIISIILSIIVFKSATSESDNEIIEQIVKKYFTAKVDEKSDLLGEKKQKLSQDIAKKDEDDYFDEKSFLNSVITNVEKKYVHDKSRKEILEAAAQGILSSLDPHSTYLKKDVFSEVKVQLDGEFGGLGIRITSDSKLIKVITPIDDTPADRAGIKAGDYISEVNGKSIYGKSVMEVVKILRGKPKTDVEITILREGEKEPLKFTLTRDIININPVKSDIYDNVSYIRLSTFSKCISFDVAKKIEEDIKKIGKDKIEGIIIDVRNNPGGALDASVNISSLFLNSGKEIVSIKGKEGDPISYKSTDYIKCNNGKLFGKKYNFKDKYNQKLLKSLPIIVLVNLGSASASEIVAGAIQDHKRGLVVGTKTFGKGSVQSLIPLNKGHSAMKLTIALYYTPSGRSIQANGIKPDIIIKEAKIEAVNNNLKSESDLEGHLLGQIEELAKQNDDQDTKKKKSDILYNNDYQLTRAVGLIKGINLYKTLELSQKK